MVLCLLLCVVVFVVYLCSLNHYLLLNIAISYAMVFYVMYVTFCNVRDKLSAFQDIDITSVEK